MEQSRTLRRLFQHMYCLSTDAIIISQIAKKKCYIPKCDIFGWIPFLSTSMHKEESSSSDRLVVCSSIPNITKYLGT